MPPPEQRCFETRDDVHLDLEKKIVRIGLRGRLTARTILAAVSSLAHQAGTHRLWDIRNADLSALDSGAIEGMTKDMASLPPVHPEVRIAIVTASDLQFGLSRMYELLIEGKVPGTYRVFRDSEEAEAWLAEEPAD